jgi:hypothetical protein
MQKNEMITIQGRKAFMNLGIKGCVTKACLALYGVLTIGHRGFRGVLGIRKERERVSSFEALVPTNQTTHYPHRKDHHVNVYCLRNTKC